MECKHLIVVSVREGGNRIRLVGGKMKLSQFSFNLPEELIRKYPEMNREKARLMVINRETGRIEHLEFKDIINFFDEGDTLVLNNTRVFPARLRGVKEKTNADIDVFLLRELKPEAYLWDVLVDPARKIRIGNKLFFGDGDVLVAEVVENTTSRGRVLRFLYDGDHAEFKERLFALGETPLPRNVGRPAEPKDAEYYQTVYASEEGAVAAPTAGLHMSKNLLKRMEIKGVNLSYITLHAGLGNFRKIEVEDLSKHKADAEQIEIPPETAAAINKSLDQGCKVCAVGTTVVRTLESSITSDKRVSPISTWTNRFLFPPYEVQIPNALISNFHLPCAPAMMTVSSFSGYELMMKAYQVAIKEKYGFGTYGDAMLVI